MLSLVRSAEMSHFTIVRDNYILAKHHICLGSGVSLEIGTVKDLQTMQYSGKYLLSLRWVNSQLMVFSNASSNALFLNKPEIEDLLENYKLTTIEMAPNSHLILEGTEIKLYQPKDELICQAGRLLLERGRAFNELIDETFEKIRLIFELNSLLKNIMDRFRMCRQAVEWKNKKVFPRLVEEFEKDKTRKSIFSYMIGEGETIS